MKRVVKPPEVRRNELLDTAQNYFSEKGYDATAVSDIIDAAGIAKGTFYHYFKSKEDLLDQMVKRLTGDIESALNKITSDPSLNALEKLNRYFIQVGNLKLENKSLIEMLIQTVYKDENILLRQKLFQQGMEIAIPKLESVLNQGSAEGLFRISYPAEAAAHIIVLIAGVNERMALIPLQATSRQTLFPTLEQAYCALVNSVERILGAPEKSICLVRRDQLKAFMET